MQGKMVFTSQSLGKRYGRQWALKDCTLELCRGEIFGLVGRNGAGKTTLMKIMCGLADPDEGNFTLFEEYKHLERQRRRLGVLIETPEFFNYMTGLQNLEYFRMQRGIADTEAPAHVMRVVELDPESKKKVKGYSLGMKQRLGIALALLGKPDMLILDEPINGIDPEGIVELRRLFKKLRDTEHVTILISSHILGELGQLADRFAIIDHGRILKVITARELYEQAGDYLRIKTDQPQRAAAVLEQSLHIKDYTVNENEEIILRGQPQRAAEISRALIERDIKLLALEQNHGDIEDYFMEAIGVKGEETHV